MISEHVTAAKEHHDGDGVGGAQRQFGVAQEYERDYNREGRKEAQQAKTQRANPVALRPPRPPGRLRPAEQTFLHNVGAEHSIECRNTIEPSDFIFDAIGSQ